MDRIGRTTSRRAVLSVVGTGLLGTAVATSRPATGVVVEQGDSCRAVRPLGGAETVADRYDYRAPFTDPSAVTFSSHGTVDLQRRDASVLFLYDGPRGRSLVMVHDALEDGTHGGSVSFEVAGLPPGREWVVEDDRYDGASNYDRWDHGRTASRIDWTWGAGRTDGAAVRGLGDDFAVRVTPAFNETAALFGRHYEGRLTAWEFLSATDGGVERVPLRMDRPVRVRTGTCDDGGDGGGGGTPADPGEAPGDVDGPLQVPLEVVPDAVDPHRPGRLPVVVHSTDGFVATRIAPRTVRAGPAGARPVAAHPVDDGRGPPDLKLLFRLPALGLDEAVDGGTGRLRLRAETRSGRRVRGADTFRVVPSRGGRGNDERDERREEREERREEREEKREERQEEREEKREDRREERDERREEREEKRDERREEREEKREERREDDEDEDDEDEDD